MKNKNKHIAAKTLHYQQRNTAFFAKREPRACNSLDNSLRGSQNGRLARKYIRPGSLSGGRNIRIPREVIFREIYERNEGRARSLLVLAMISVKTFQFPDNNTKAWVDISFFSEIGENDFLQKRLSFHACAVYT